MPDFDLNDQTVVEQCETPKSPPGDYNYLMNVGLYPTVSISCVKHLNPRQGITTRTLERLVLDERRTVSVKHLNPRQGITTEEDIRRRRRRGKRVSVKHLNPRQGITTPRLLTDQQPHRV